MTINTDSFLTGRLISKHGAPIRGKTIKTGLQPLGLDTEHESLLYLPAGYTPQVPATLAVLLHGSGGAPLQGIGLLQRHADTHNLILLAPAAHLYTWDLVATHAYGRDVLFLDQALALLFDTYAINPVKLALGGFSDGASYALSLGLTNGDLFTHLIAFSPGFWGAKMPHGNPDIFISHGVQDKVLPIDQCGRKVAEELMLLGKPVKYLEFAGGHEVPDAVTDAAVNWLLTGE